MFVKKMLPKTQHYVPKFILKNFCDSKSQVNVFDKKRETVFRTNIKNAAAETGFYNIQEDATIFSVEQNLSNLETIAAKIIQKIIKEEALTNITDEEKLSLSVFIAAQFARVKHMRNIMKQVNDLLVKRLTEMGVDPNKVEGFTPADDIEIKKSTVIGLREAIVEFTPYIYDKAWVLFKAPKSTSYYISDNPVTLQNMYDFGPRGNLGLAVKGIEIYFPLSRKLSLGIFCRSHEELIHTAYVKYLIVHGAGLLEDLEKNKENIAGVKRLMNGLATGKAIQAQQENVINLNSLQVIYSSRFIYSSSNNFELVRDMLKTNPELKEPPSIRE